MFLFRGGNACWADGVTIDVKPPLFAHVGVGGQISQAVLEPILGARLEHRIDGIKNDVYAISTPIQALSDFATLQFNAMLLPANSKLG